MQNKAASITKIGWDIGGAHLKYCVISNDSDIIWYDIIDFEFWKEYKKFKNIVIKINSIYSKKTIILKTILQCQQKCVIVLIIGLMELIILLNKL